MHPNSTSAGASRELRTLVQTPSAGLGGMGKKRKGEGKG